MTAADKILQKALIGSNLDTKGWSKIQASLRDRAFFSAQVEEQKILYAMRQNVAEIAASRKSPSEARRDLREYLTSIGYDPGENRGTIKDLLTKRRLDIMLKTNVDQAKGYVTHLRATTPGAILAFPGYELVRVEKRKMPRDWSARWQKAGNSVGWEGAARDRFIALKTSPIWAKLSVFGNPYPPFDFNSGMGLKDVKKSVCRELGLLGENEQPKIPDPPDFNGHLQTTVPFEKGSHEFQQLTESFGDQIKYDKTNHSVEWRSDLFSRLFDDIKANWTIKLGKPSKSLMSKLPSSIDSQKLVNKQLIVTQDYLNHKRKQGGDHRVHFEQMSDQPNDIPLNKGDVDMLPSLWRSPDRVKDSHGKLFLEVDAIDGGVFCAVVDIENEPILKTFYRTKNDLA